MLFDADALENNEQPTAFREARRRLAADPYRPTYHFVVPEGLMNDPNGAAFWQGQYHLFYQFLPDGADGMHWGHTVSDDLVHWRDLPIALCPELEKGCWSGEAVVEEDRVIAMYYGHPVGNCIATSSDPLLLDWCKHPANPVIPVNPSGEPYRVFDPCIWKEDDAYYSLSGSYTDGAFLVDCRPAAYLFRSEDLEHWEYLHPLVADGFLISRGEDAACPNFFPLGDKHVLLFFSHPRGGQYYIGDYDTATHKLTPLKHGRTNHTPPTLPAGTKITDPGAGNLHAPAALLDDQDRRIIFFNIRGGKPLSHWSGMMSLPRVISLADDLTLQIEPVPELQQLRHDPYHIAATPLAANQEAVLAGAAGNALEIEALIHPQSAHEVGLKILRSPDGAEQTLISYYPDVTALCLDTSCSTLHSDAPSRAPEVAPLALGDGEPLHLRIYVDRSIVEVFANGRQSLTACVYPQRPDSIGISAYARRGDALLESLDVWQMKPIWPTQ
ncbi:MAG: glycoside hydrolase family 32 protein [Armatimonadetes bacterium]|nr:glycoside hydrolase family 32 protein [Armatimonadota bacterium]